MNFCPEFEICTSDHKPVYGVFRLAVPRSLSDRTGAFEKIVHDQQGGRDPSRCATTRRVAMKLITLNVDGLDDSLTVLILNTWYFAF